MNSLVKDAIELFSKLPDEASIDDLMYQLYVLEKWRKGGEAIEKGDVISIEELDEEIEKW